MQYQKDEVKGKIRRAAAEEFSEKGYRQAAISRIAKRSGVPVGNLYRYFPGKDKLFHAVVEDAAENLPGLIKSIYERDIALDRSLKQLAENIADSIMHIYREYGKALLILVDRSQGSSYEHYIPDLKRQISSLFLAGIYREDTPENALMANLIADGFMEGLFTIMRCGDPVRVEQLVKSLLLFYFYRIEDRI